MCAFITTVLYFLFQTSFTTLQTLQAIVILKMEHANVQRTSNVPDWKFALRTEHAKVCITHLSEYTLCHQLILYNLLSNLLLIITIFSLFDIDKYF